MKKLLKSSLIKNYLVILIFSLLLEISFRLISGIKLDIAILRVFIGLNVFSIGISFIASWFNYYGRKIFLIAVCLAYSLYAFFQMGFNNFIGVYASVNSSSQLGAVTDYIRDFLASFSIKYYLIFILFGIILIYYIFLDKRIENKLDKKFPLKDHIRYERGIRTITSILAMVFFSVLYYESLSVSFMQNELQSVSNVELFKNPSVSSLAINQFGVLGFGFLDVKSLVVEGESNLDYAFNFTESSDREFDDSAWEEIIDNETDSTLNSINMTLINNKITSYNDYTGLFKDKNLIVVMMESVNDIIINEELYPNFYKLYSEGISFKNNYSPRNSCSTGNNEFSGMTGIYTIQNNCTANVYKNNTYFTSIFNLFNNAGYTTSSMHDYTEAYYYRSTIHRNLGSGAYYGAGDLGINYYNEYRNWASDEDFMDAAMDIILEDTSKPFMTWLTTVSSHQPYKVSSVEGDKYLSITDGTDYPMDLRRYMSKLKTLDNALGILLDRLEDAGILDDTVILLYGDHYPYGLKNNTINYVLDYDLSDYEVERVPMVIYNSNIEAQVVEKYSSFINITPTVANLFDLDYDPRYYMGSDVFSDDYLDLVVFADGSWKNSEVYYNASDSSVTYYTDSHPSIEEIKNINNIVTTRMKTSVSIIENNYFAYLENKLNDIDKNSVVLVEEDTDEKSSNSGKSR